MIKNIVFDIGNVILRFDIDDVLNRYTKNEQEREFIKKNIINSPEWLGNSLIDTGFITKETAIKIVQDRTNHEEDSLIEHFWNNYNDYAKVDTRVLDIINELKNKEYNVYLLSNINPYTHEFVKKSGLMELVDGHVLSYQEHEIKPYIRIYTTLLNRYDLIPEETLFIDDNQRNIDTGNRLGIISKKVEPDNYESVLSVIVEEKLL